MPVRIRNKKPKPKKPYQKVQDFLEGYKQLAILYDVPLIPEVEKLYGPIIEKKGRRLPQMIQFADTNITAIQLRPLIEAYKSFEIRVKIFSFLNTNSGNDGMHVLGHSFEPPLEIVGIAYHANHVTESGCRGFARSMILSKTLNILELDFNPEISDLGVIGLTMYGPSLSLNRLSLRYCNISDEGAIALGKWISNEQCAIKELFLSGNKIGPIGIIGFSEGLSHNKSLNRLELQDNLFGYDLNSMNALHDAIESCPTIQFINLLHNFECPKGIDIKFVELTKLKSLGECVLTPKLNNFYFQSMRSNSLSNKRKIIKENKRIARENRRIKIDTKVEESNIESSRNISSSRAQDPTPRIPVTREKLPNVRSTTGTIP